MSELSNILTITQLFELAAIKISLEIDGERSLKYWRCYPINDQLLEKLVQYGFKRYPGTSKEILCRISLEGDQAPDRNYWEIKKEDPQFYISISLSLEMEDDRGIALLPYAIGNYISYCDNQAHLRMFKALVESDEHDSYPDIVRKIATSDGFVIVTWAELGLDGVQHISRLFRDIFGENDNIMFLAENSSIFNPPPFYQNNTDDKKVFVPRSLQGELVQKWKDQIEEFRDSLFINNKQP